MPTVIAIVEGEAEKAAVPILIRRDGIVGAVAWTGRVNVSGSGSVFVDQIVLKPPPGSGSFSQDGDSGSLVWTAAAPHAAVGLLFAGNRTGSLTLAHPIDAVLGALDINLI